MAADAGDGKGPAGGFLAPSEPAASWGTQNMGAPAAPTAHPQNQAAALWTARAIDSEPPPYVITSDPQPRQQRPFEHIHDFFNTWTRRAEELANNIWLNLKTAPSMSDAALGKMELGTKALTEGGFEALYKQSFPPNQNERLRKTFACYLSTSTGPVAGTLYLTNMNVAFCSDRPLSFPAPSGQIAWSYYKILIPLEKMATVDPVTLRENPPEKFIHIVTVDGHEFWFMGFVSFDKAVHNLVEAVSSYAAWRASSALRG